MRLPKTAGRLGALLFAAILATLAVLARNWKESDAAAALPPSPTGLWQSSLVTEPISGFGGPTPVNIALDPDSGAIRSIEFLPNAEDPEYWQRVVNADLFAAFPGRTPAEAMQLPVDAVTGATLSSQAAIQTVRAVLARAAAVPAPSAVPLRELFPFGWAQWLALLLFAGNLVVLFRPLRGGWRIFQLTLNVVIFGFCAHFYFSLALTTGWLRTLPHPALSWLLFLFAAVVVIIVLTGRNFYCNHLCPFGCLQELAAKAGHKAGCTIPGPTSFPGGYLRRILLNVAIAGALLQTTFPLFEPFSFFRLQSWWMIAAGLGIVGVSFFLPRLWCRWFCGFGACMDFFRRETPAPIQKGTRHEL